MSEPSSLSGLKRLVNSAKVQFALAKCAGAYVAAHYAAQSIDPSQRAWLWIAFLGAVGLIGREVINGWTEEDVARIQNSSPVALPAPDSSMTQIYPRPVSSPDPAPAIAATAPPTRPASGAAKPLAAVVAASLTSTRTSSMPARTKLPVVFFALLSLSLLFAGGCQQLQQAASTCPELVTYREGLHAVDEPLYAAHEKLMSDAVKAGIRTSDQNSIVEAGIAEARALYSQSVKTQASSVVATPATQP